MVIPQHAAQAAGRCASFMERIGIAENGPAEPKPADHLRHIEKHLADPCVSPRAMVASRCFARLARFKKSSKLIDKASA